MADPLSFVSSLLGVSNFGIMLVASTTQYLSTLPHSIDTVEELVAVISVLSNLLSTLHSTISRFSASGSSSSSAPFLLPLCNDVQSAFSMFAKKMKEAKDLKVFQPNDVGLVRAPKFAWAFVMGGEAEMSKFRSRLYVEKYRVRVLIDAVAWRGLKSIVPMKRTDEQERELQRLRRMSPLIAERMVGVCRDYETRLEGGKRAVKKQTLLENRMEEKPPVGVKFEDKPGEKDNNKYDGGHGDNQVRSTAGTEIRRSSSVSTLVSDTSSISVCSEFPAKKPTISDNEQIIYERWLLRYHASTRTVTASTTLFLFTVLKTHSHSPGHHYVKSIPSHPSEIRELLSHHLASGASVEKQIQDMPEQAQWEVQRLLEKRSEASSNGSVSRAFEVCTVRTQPRSKHAPATKPRKWWSLGSKTEKARACTEYVLLLKGQTVDRKQRVLPVKDQDPWKPKVVTLAPKPLAGQQLLHMQQQQQAALARMAAQRNQLYQGGPRGAQVLRHVEHKRGVSLEEAERRMDEVFGKLFTNAEEKEETRVIESDDQTPRPEADLDHEVERNPFD